jgi:hypothetical protein
MNTSATQRDTFMFCPSSMNQLTMSGLQKESATARKISSDFSSGFFQLDFPAEIFQFFIFAAA